jgi:hypothetical protein
VAHAIDRTDDDVAPLDHVRYAVHAVLDTAVMMAELGATSRRNRPQVRNNRIASADVKDAGAGEARRSSLVPAGVLGIGTFRPRGGRLRSLFPRLLGLFQASFGRPRACACDHQGAFASGELAAQAREAPVGAKLKGFLCRWTRCQRRSLRQHRSRRIALGKCSVSLDQGFLPAPLGAGGASLQFFASAPRLREFRGQFMNAAPMEMGQHVNFAEDALFDAIGYIPVRHHRPIPGCDLTGIAQPKPELDHFGLGLRLGGQADGTGVAPIQQLGEGTRQRAVGLRGVRTVAVDLVVRRARVERQALSDRVAQLSIAQARTDDGALCAPVDLP